MIQAAYFKMIREAENELRLRINGKWNSWGIWGLGIVVRNVVSIQSWEEGMVPRGRARVKLGPHMMLSMAANGQKWLRRSLNSDGEESLDSTLVSMVMIK